MLQQPDHPHALSDEVIRGLVDVLVGAVATSPVRVVSEDDLGLVSTLTWATSELHANKHKMHDGTYGERLFPGPAVVAMVVGLHAAVPAQRDVFHENRAELGVMISMRARYAAAVLVGDHLTSTTTIVAVTRDTGPDGGPGNPLVHLEDKAINQRGDTVVVLERTHRLEGPGI